MPSHEDRQPRPQTGADEQAPDPAVPDEDSIAHAKEVSSKAEDLINGIDDLVDEVHDALLSAVFEPGEVVTPEEFDLRSEKMWKEFVNKGGQ